VSTSDFLNGRFLLALPRLDGDFFSGTVTLLIEHNTDGAFGLVVNQPGGLSLGEVLGRDGLEGIPVHLGGPVEPDRLFFLHTPEARYEGAYRVNDFVCMSTSTALIEDVRNDTGPRRLMALVGYAGWGAGQLEQELKQEIWLTASFSADILFEVPAGEKMTALANRMGVDLNLISTDTRPH
jgi:putative transcriptional regulator